MTLDEKRVLMKNKTTENKLIISCSRLPAMCSDSLRKLRENDKEKKQHSGYLRSGDVVALAFEWVSLVGMTEHTGMASRENLGSHATPGLFVNGLDDAVRKAIRVPLA